MNYEEYRKAFFVDPPPEPRYAFSGGFALTLYFEAYEEAITYYSTVLGSPAYVEGSTTRSWAIGNGWLTLLKGSDGNPRNVDVMFEMKTPAEAERLQQALLAAGGFGPSPSDQLMHTPVRACPVRDPFGVDLMVFSKNGERVEPPAPAA